MSSNVFQVLERDFLTEPNSLQSPCKIGNEVYLAENIFKKGFFSKAFALGNPFL